MRGREREDREAKWPRDSGRHSGARSLIAAHHGRGNVSRPVHLTLPASSGTPATHRFPVSRYAPPLSSEPPTRDAFGGQSNRPGTS